MAGNERSVRLNWTGEGLRFRGGGTDPVSPAIEIDGENETAPGPMLQLLLAAAACSAADVVLILGKMRAGLRTLAIDVTGERRSESPQRYESVRFRFSLAGDNVNLEKAERAVNLSLEKYCSVVHSLAPDIRVSHEIDVS